MKSTVGSPWKTLSGAPSICPEHTPPDNRDYPWHMIGRFAAETDFLGSCFNVVRDPAPHRLGAEHRSALMEIYSDVYKLVDTCVSMTLWRHPAIARPKPRDPKANRLCKNKQVRGYALRAGVM